MTTTTFNMDSDAPFWSNDFTPENFTLLQEARLAAANTYLNKLLLPTENRTVDNSLSLYDKIRISLDSVAEQSSLLENVHPDPNFRAACEILSQKAAAFYSELSLNRGIYDALAAIPREGLDSETEYYLEKTLRDFRLSGVDKGKAIRENIQRLNDEITLIEQEFSRNIRDSTLTVYAENVAELDGLPADFIAAHPPDDDGRIGLTTEYPDSVPILAYAKSDRLRREMYFAMNNRAYPENETVLSNLLSKRFELAKLLGFDNFADFVTADKMTKSAQNASEFIAKIVDVAAAKTQAEYLQLLKRKQDEFPRAELVSRWESNYYKELVGKEEYGFDSQTMRPFYAYENVKNGVLDVSARLFGVSFRQLLDADVWDKSVECWEMVENGELVGRFYLDMHPREGKYNHAAQFGIRNGVAGIQIPEACLVCNFPEPKADNPALMEQSDVETLFHEFGHLLHTLFASKSCWIGLNGITTEWDFVEAPSQMLEEWAQDAQTLQTFAKNYKTGEPIPTELVDRMRRAKEFGKGLLVTRQMEFARLSLSLHDREPSGIDFDEMTALINTDYSPFEFVEGTHMQDSFGHLQGYSAIYYTYMWSLVLAKDLFSKFDSKNLMAPEIAKSYREKILSRGGSQPASSLVESFLGRKSNFDAFENWISEK